MADYFSENQFFFTWTRVRGVIEVADFDSEVIFNIQDGGSKMADVFQQINFFSLKFVSRGLSGSLIAIMMSDFKYSIWEIQYGGHVFTKTFSGRNKLIL